MRIIHVDSYSPTGFLAKHIKEVDKFPERIDHYWGFRVLSRIKKNYPNTECIFIRPGVDREPVTANIKGVKIMGICNGVQILQHAGLLPGKFEENDFNLNFHLISFFLSFSCFCGWIVTLLTPSAKTLIEISAKPGTTPGS